MIWICSYKLTQFIAKALKCFFPAALLHFHEPHRHIFKMLVFIITLRKIMVESRHSSGTSHGYTLYKEALILVMKTNGISAGDLCNHLIMSL